jgi:hypothetical protein
MEAVIKRQQERQNEHDRQGRFIARSAYKEARNEYRRYIYQTLTGSPVTRLQSQFSDSGSISISAAGIGHPSSVTVFSLQSQLSDSD